MELTQKKLAPDGDHNVLARLPVFSLRHADQLHPVSCLVLCTRSSRDSVQTEGLHRVRLLLDLVDDLSALAKEAADEEALHSKWVQISYA